MHWRPVNICFEVCTGHCRDGVNVEAQGWPCRPVSASASGSVSLSLIQQSYMHSMGEGSRSGLGYPLQDIPGQAHAELVGVRSKAHAVGTPERVISRPAALSSLPTSAFASLKARASIGPDGGTPTCHSLVRPG